MCSPQSHLLTIPPRKSGGGFFPKTLESIFLVKGVQASLKSPVTAVLSGLDMRVEDVAMEFKWG